jgi:hypothetical protein
LRSKGKETVVGAVVILQSLEVDEGLFVICSLLSGLSRMGNSRHPLVSGVEMYGLVVVRTKAGSLRVKTNSCDSHSVTPTSVSSLISSLCSCCGCGTSHWMQVSRIWNISGDFARSTSSQKFLQVLPRLHSMLTTKSFVCGSFGVIYDRSIFPQTS